MGQGLLSLGVGYELNSHPNTCTTMTQRMCQTFYLVSEYGSIPSTFGLESVDTNE